jgi:nucleoid-associated protein YgaU
MQKDMKIGMFLGLILAGAVMVYICTRPSLSPKARMLRQNREDSNEPEQTYLLSVESKPANEIKMETEEPLQVVEQAVEPVEQQIQFAEEIEPESIPEPEAEPKPVYIERSYQTHKFYIVRKGDTLSKISKRYYGTANKWQKIFEANRDLLDNPNMLKPGMKLHIPN